MAYAVYKTSVPLCICLKLLGAGCYGQQNDIPVQRFIRSLFVSCCVLVRFPLFVTSRKQCSLKENLSRNISSHRAHSTERGGSGGKAFDLHSGGIRFENRMKHGLFPLSSSKQMSERRTCWSRSIRGLTIKFANPPWWKCYMPHCWIPPWSPSKYSPWEAMHRCQSPFKTVLEMILWNGLQSCRCITPEVINVTKMPSFRYFLYLPE